MSGHPCQVSDHCADSSERRPDPDALMIALILAPATFSRNKFYEMYEDRILRMARRRAQMVRSLVKELTEPWPLPGEFPSHPSPIEVSQRELPSDPDNPDQPTHLLSFSIPEFNYRRQARLTALEAAALRYCLARANVADIGTTEKSLVERHLTRLSPLAPAEP